MYKKVIGLFALCFTLLGTASSVQAQPRRPAQPPAPSAHAVTPSVDDDVVMGAATTDGSGLTCGGPDTICVVQERQRAQISQHQAALAVLQAQVARLAAAPSVRPTPRVAARPSTATRPAAPPVRTPIVRIRAIEVGLDDLGARFETVINTVPALISLQAQCELQRNNPQIRLPAGTNCSQVAHDLQAAQDMAARPPTPARPAGRPTP